MKYGNKDIMRMESIRDKSHGDKFKELQYALNMANAIDLAGKAMARAYAAQEIFGEYSPVAYIFFEKAYDLGGEDVKPEASVIIAGTTDSEDVIEEAYSNIDEDKLPASRRPDKNPVSRTKKNKVSNLYPLGRINVVKGSGPNYSVYDFPGGITEVWATKSKPRLIITANNEPNFNIGDLHDFSYNGKTYQWKMIDYIESEYMGNLAPLYGKSLTSYNYD